MKTACIVFYSFKSSLLFPKRGSHLEICPWCWITLRMRLCGSNHMAGKVYLLEFWSLRALQELSCLWFTPLLVSKMIKNCKEIEEWGDQHSVLTSNFAKKGNYGENNYKILSPSFHKWHGHFNTRHVGKKYSK